jgi:hypothetical protein
MKRKGMMINPLLLLNVIVVMCIVAFPEIDSSWAKDKKKQTVRPSQSQAINEISQKVDQQVKQPEYDIKPFDLTIEKLPSDYKGYDIEKLYHELENKFPKKDEFETKEAYIKRIQSFGSNDLYAFGIEKHTISLHSKYDAESQLFEVIITSTQKTEKTVIVTKSSPEGTREYLASNAYGAQIVVKEYRGTQYGIGLVNKEKFGTGGVKEKELFSFFKFLKGFKEHSIKINLLPDIARSLKENLGILLICQLRASSDPISYVFKSYLHSKPTFDKPTELSYSQKFVFVNLLEIWVYHTKTGTIFAKEKIGSAKNEKI